MKLLINEWGNKKYKVIINKKRLFHESKFLSLNISKAKKELNWQNRDYPLKETVNFTVDWYKNYFSDKKIINITTNQIEDYSNK